MKGSVKKDGSTYYYIIDLARDPVTNARRQKKKRGFKTKKEAQMAVAAAINELSKGTHIEETDMSFESFSAFWLNEYASSGRVKPSSVRVREKEIKMFLRYFSKIPIKDITKKMYANALMKMQERGLKDNTISGAHGCGKMIFKRAVELDMIKTNVTEFTRAPRTILSVEDVENKVEIPKYLEKEELALFLKTAQMHGLMGDYETFHVLAYTGMRVGEFVVLRETDVVDHTIKINRTYYNPDNNAVKYKVQTPKTLSSIREIEVDELTIGLIEKYKTKIKELKMKYRNQYYDKGYLFPNTERYPGYPNFVKTVENRMERLLKIANLNTALTPHSLRHTHTSLLAAAGVPLDEIMDRLGHKDDKTTRLVYLHVTKERKKEASKKFGELMRNL